MLSKFREIKFPFYSDHINSDKILRMT